MKWAYSIFVLFCTLATIVKDDYQSGLIEGQWKVEGHVEGRAFTDYWQFKNDTTWCELKYSQDESNQLDCKAQGIYRLKVDSLSITYLINTKEFTTNPTLRFNFQQRADTIFLILKNDEEFLNITNGVNKLMLTKIIQ